MADDSRKPKKDVPPEGSDADKPTKGGPPKDPNDLSDLIGALGGSYHNLASTGLDLTALMPNWTAATALNWPPTLDPSSPVVASGVSTIFSSEQGAFQARLIQLREQVTEQARNLQAERTSGKKKSEQIAKLNETLEELQKKEQLGFLLSRVNRQAQERLLTVEQFRAEFLSGKECQAFVMSVDIRRSTELMLKARNPELFASFITELCVEFSEIITESFGVFDKFTGDGVLAFFPDFYSGSDGALRVISVADQCHAAFTRRYKARRGSFSSVLTDIGLGIGIDYGSVRLVQVAGGLTVVGAPVVYACRLSGAPAGTTLVNQPAFEVISDKFGARCFISETEVAIKHEGSMLAYEVRLNDRHVAAKAPDWTTAQ